MPPRLDLYPGFVLTPDPDISGALFAMAKMVDYDNGDELPGALLSVLLFGLVANEDIAMRAFERMSVHYKDPHSKAYADFWSAFLAVQYVFRRRYANDHDLKNMLHDVLPHDCEYCEEGLLRVTTSKSGRHFHIS
jgi:hypothetical protein